MTTRGEINSNFYQIVNVDANGAPTSVKTQYITTGNVDHAETANVANVANSVAGANVTGTVASANTASTAVSASIANIANTATVALSVAGSNVTGYVANATHANIADVANSVAGANVTGTVATANYASFAGNVTLAGQANITSLGNLTGLTVDGQTSLGAVSNVHITGGTSGYVLSTDGLGNLSWAAGGSGNGVPGGSNTEVQYNNDGNFAGSSTFTFNSTTNLLTVGNISANGSQLTSLTGGNVTGYVPNATHANIADVANSVAGANVTGTVANATFATSAGSATTAITVTASNQPNITTVGTLTSLDVTGNISSLANISGGYIFGDGSYLTGIGNLSASNGYWGSFYSNVNQTIASTTTAYPITLNNSDPDSNGVYISSSSRINFQFAGTYNIQFSVQLVNTDAAAQEASIWIRKNGTDVIDSRGTIAVADKQGSVNGQTISSWNYILKLASSDYVEFIWQAESTSVSLENLPAGTTPTTPAAPSMIVTAQQVTNVQPVELQGDMSGNIIGNGFSLINIASISSVDGITGNTFTGNGAPLTNLTGANVTGYVANATHANIADAANVAYSVSGANVTGDVSGANHANIADSANSVAGSNVSGAVAFATTANSVAGGNVSGAVNLATYADTANSVAGSNVSGAVNLANFATTANAVAGANVSGTVALATHADFADTANSVSGSNISGQVANALVAGTVYTNSQPNITSVGNLTTLIVSGNAATEEVLFVGAGANAASFINPTLIAKNTGATYIQAAIINDSANGSSDWVAYGDNSTDVNAWADMGFTSSNFSDPLYTITGSNDGYFFVQGDGASTHGANLVIATGAQGSVKDIVFATGGFLANNEKMRFIHSTGQFYIQPTTAASSTTTGALRVDGGVGIGGSAYVGANLNVLGETSLGSVSNVHITGGTSGQVLTTDGTGTLSFTTVTSGGTPGGSNTQVQFNDGGAFGGVANLTFDKTTNTLTATNIAGNGAGLTSLTGANVTGAVAYATTANAVALANVSGAGNIASINLTGSTSNVLYGNGVFADITGITAANANAVLSNTSTATVVYPMFTSVSGNAYVGTLKNTGITANLAANSITATTFNGDLTGTATNATNIVTTVDGSNTSVQYLTFVGNSSTGAINGAKIDTSLQWFPSNNTLTTAQFNGALVGSNGNGVTNSSSVDIASATGNILATVAGTVRANVHTTGMTITGVIDSSSTVTAPTFVSNIASGTAPFTVTSTTQVANLNVATAGLATYATTANAVAGANVSGEVGFAAVANSVAVANVSGIGNIATINLTGSSSNVLYGNGVFAAQSGGGGSPGGANTYVQFNDGGTFGGVANLTFDNTSNTLTATNVTVTGLTNLGSVGNINISGGTSGYVLSTNGSGNLSWVAQSGGGGSVGFEQTFLLMGA